MLKILLRLDWFQQTKVVIIPTNRQIIMPLQMIFCINEDESEENTNEREFNDDCYYVLITQPVDDNKFDEALFIKYKEIHFQKFME